MAESKAGTTTEGIEILDPAECHRLLGLGGVGCLGLPTTGAPILRPVNFVVCDGAIVLRTGEGPILEAARRGALVAFETDDIDRLEHTGWSVIVEGALAELPTDEATLGLPLRAWASGRRDRFVGIVPTEVSGRRIPPGRGNR